ncbi:hypothetical protein QEN19_003343 [Hanseniaspora menglaensis]
MRITTKKSSFLTSFLISVTLLILNFKLVSSINNDIDFEDTDNLPIVRFKKHGNTEARSVNFVKRDSFKKTKSDSMIDSHYDYTAKNAVDLSHSDIFKRSSILGISTSSSSNNTGGSKHIKTTSLLTCMEDSQFSSTFFDVSYYPQNKSVVFNIEATTTLSSKIMIELQVITYGLIVISKKVNLCSLNEASLCPMNAGRIDISSTYAITSDLVNEIPNVAYTVPDIDAMVKVLAYTIPDSGDVDYDSPVACVIAPLTNGKTVEQTYASWIIAAISGVGILTSAIFSIRGTSAINTGNSVMSTTAAHIASNSISLFTYFQNLSILAMMAVTNLPPIAAAWCQNFQWSMGLIRVQFMQKWISWYTQSTGGVVTNILKNKSVLSIYVQKKLKKRGISLSKSFSDSIFSDSSLYTSDERNITAVASKTLILRGMNRVAYEAGIEVTNIFLTSIVFLLFILFVFLVGLTLFKSIMELMIKGRILRAENFNKFLEFRLQWGTIIKGTLFRMIVIAFPQLILMCIYEFTQNNSTAVLVDAIVIFAISLTLLGYATFQIFKTGRQGIKFYKNPAYFLFGDLKFLNKFGFMYIQFKASCYWWLIPFLAYIFLKSLFVACLQSYGKEQSVIVWVIETFYFIGLCIYKPYLDKRTNVFNISIHLVNWINSLFFVFFSTIFGQPLVVSSVMGVVLFVMNAVFALYLLIFIFVTCFMAMIKKNPDLRYKPLKDDRNAFFHLHNNKLDGAQERSAEDYLELSDLGKQVMKTNETDQQKMYRHTSMFQEPKDVYENSTSNVEEEEYSLHTGVPGKLYNSGNDFGSYNNDSSMKLDNPFGSQYKQSSSIESLKENKKYTNNNSYQQNPFADN